MTHLSVSMRPVRRALFFISCFLCFYPAFSQDKAKIDSLVQVLKTQPGDNTKVETLNELAWELRKTDATGARGYAQQAIQLSDSLGFERGRIDGCVRLGQIAIFQKEYGVAEEIFLEVLEDEIREGFLYGIGRAKTVLGEIYKNKGDLDKAVKYSLEALDVFETSNNTNMVALASNNIGAIYKDMGDYDEAEYYLSKSLELRKQLGDEGGIGLSYLNLGSFFIELENYAEAINYLEKSKDIFEKLNDRYGLAKVYNNLWAVYFRLKNYEIALEYHERSLSLKKELGLEDKYLTTHENTPDAEAFEYAEEELEKLKRNQKNIGFLLLFTLLLSTLIIRNQKQRAKLKFAEKNLQLKQQKIEELLKTQELKYINAMIAGQEEERKRIARDLHDRLGSMLAMVKIHYKSVEENIENLKADNKKQYEKANDLLDTACEEVRKIAHDMISGVLMKFGLVAALNDLKTTLEQTNHIKVDFIAYGLDNRLNNDTEISMYRIIQELISNILKHAAAKEITLQLIRNNGNLNLVVEDDGAGFDVQHKKDSGMGLKNVASRVEKLNGEFIIDSTKGNGTTVTIDIPLQNK